MANTEQLLEQILEFLKKAQTNNMLREDAPSQGELLLKQSLQRSLGEDQKFQADLLKLERKSQASQERYNNSTWRYLRGQRTRGGVFRGIAYAAQERITKQALRNYFRSKGRNYNSAQIDKLYQKMPNFNKGILGGIGSVIGSLTKLTKGLGAAAWVVTLFVDALKATAEARKFYVPSIRQGYGFNSLGGLVGKSTETINLLRNPLISGAYANNKGFKDAVKNIMSAGVLNDTTLSSTEELIKSFRFIASQGIILGETFDETAKNFIDIASRYNLGSGNYVETYKYVNKVIEKGIQDGISKTGMQQLFMQYDKSAAVSRNGLLNAIKVFDVMFRTIEDINKNREQMPQYLDTFRNLMSNKVSNLSTFAALVARTNTSVDKNKLEQLAIDYQDMPGFGQKVLAFRNMKQLTGLGTASLIELYKSEFGAFGNEVGRKVLTKLGNDKNLTYRFFNEAKDYTPEQMAKWFGDNLNLTSKERKDIEKVAQITEVMSNPLETLVTIATGILNLMWSMAGSKLFQLSLGDLNIGDAKQYINEGQTKTGRALNQIRQLS